MAFAGGAGFVGAGGAGHIDVESGFGPWPDGERPLAQLIDAVNADQGTPAQVASR